MSGLTIGRSKNSDDDPYVLTQRIIRTAKQLEMLASCKCAKGEAIDNGNRGMNKAKAVRNYLRARRLRDRFIAEDLFGEPAWDMLLDLYASYLEGKVITTSSACMASGVPSTSALRWLNRLIQLGLVERFADLSDGRRVNVQLTPEGRKAIGSWIDFSMAMECFSIVH